MKGKTHGIDLYKKAIKRFRYDPDTGNLYYIQKTNKSAIGDIGGFVDETGYLKVSIAYKHIAAHRLAYYIMEGELPECIDHINGIRNDNRWLNIRGCTYTQNSMNRPMSSNNTSGYKGVVRNRNTWRVKFKSNGKVYSKCGFLTAELANIWAVGERNRIQGQYAHSGVLSIDDFPIRTDNGMVFGTNATW